MADFKYNVYLNYNANALFDKLFSPGDITPQSGIYGCEVCDNEIASNVGNPLPAQNHAQHNNSRQPIVWRLRVASIYR